MLDFSYNQAASGGVTSTPRKPNHSGRQRAFMAINQIPANWAEAQPVTVCRVCGDGKPPTDFYARQIRKCGLVGECKECTKARVRRSRADNIDYYRSYDRLRYREDPERAAHCQAMGKTVSPEARAEKQRERRRTEPEKFRARHAVSNAIRDGKMVRGDTCFFCGGDHRVQAHHHDYNRPLDVYWLCGACHGKLHAINGDFHRPKP